jgi:hypothetical protein
VVCILFLEYSVVNVAKSRGFTQNLKSLAFPQNSQTQEKLAKWSPPVLPAGTIQFPAPSRDMQSQSGSGPSVPSSLQQERLVQHLPSPQRPQKEGRNLQDLDNRQSFWAGVCYVHSGETRWFSFAFSLGLTRLLSCFLAICSLLL